MLLEPQLYVLGKILKKDSKAIAIVGTRTPTEYGKKAAYKFSYELSKKGFTIISGMARGIDSVAHRAAIEAGGRTIAVLGCGVDIVYPPENKDLYSQIVKKGAVVSEFKNGTKPLPKNFLARNRIIAYLSQAVLIVEGKRRSGTISTAHHAADLGVEVFAVPGNINSKMSEAPNHLIKQGAYIATSVDDILEIIA